LISLLTFARPQGDTPVQRISILLQRLDKALESASIPDEARSILSEARAVSDGLDPYLDRVSKKPAPVIQQMMDATDDTDWEALHKAGKTSFPLIPTVRPPSVKIPAAA
jgi:hypothetical protein